MTQPTPQDDARTARRLLKALLVLLVAGAVILLLLLIWLLRPKSSIVVGPSAAGYPVHTVGVIYGYGNDPSQMLKTPLDATFDTSGNVWIADTGSSRVLEFTTSGQFVRSVGDQQGPGKLYAPYGVAIDQTSGRVYVSDFSAHAVRIFSTSTGAYIGSLPAAGTNPKVFGSIGFTPYDVGVINGRVVVSSNDGLYFFDSSGNVVAAWHGKGPGPAIGQFHFPDSFAVDPNTGHIYVADSLNRRVVALDSNAKWLWVSGTPDAGGNMTGFWQLPRSIVVGPDGNVYVDDTFRYDPVGVGAGNFVVLSPDGQFLSEFGKAGTFDDSFAFPEGMAVRSDGLFAVADRANNRVILFKLSSPLPKPTTLEQQKWQPVVTPINVYSTPMPSPAIFPSPAPAFGGGGTTGGLGNWIALSLVLLIAVAIVALVARRRSLKREAAARDGGG